MRSTPSKAEAFQTTPIRGGRRTTWSCNGSHFVFRGDTRYAKTWWAEHHRLLQSGRS